MSFLPYGVQYAISLFNRLEKWSIVTLVGFLSGFALLQIILRNFFSTGFVWGDTLQRHLVLWIGFLGASQATSEGRHIHIDVIPRVLSGRASRILLILSDLFPTIISSVLFFASIRFVGSERLAGDMAMDGIPYWWFELIFPYGFAVFTIRFGYRTLKHFLPVDQDGGK